ncbi:MAG: tripartite tricarboxylate transporter TctB family protein [Oscillospiraceae bacterium]|nr:tripartite tricarboxylate transporter TctB family protein [Oscillospiraceae bacterium]
MVSLEVKKTQSKAFANLIASLALIVFEIWAWLQTNNIKTAKNAAVQPSTFPRIMIIGMAVFTVVLLIQSLIKLGSMKTDDPLAEKAETLNFIKDKGVLAALFVVLLCCVYVYFFKSLGYVIVSFLLSGIIMWLIGLRKPVPLILISALVPLLMWLVFYKMLKVNIPMGPLQFLRELVDKI